MHRRDREGLTTPDPSTDAASHIAALAEHAGRSAVIVDFDGSVAPIVDDPAAAAADPRVLEALRAAVPQFAVVAVVSGRPVEFLAERLPVPGLVLVGQYGLETSVDGVQTIDPRVELFVDAVDEAAAAFERSGLGLAVERKGVVATALHWRTAPDREAAALELAREVAGRTGLELMTGRMVAELRPAIPVDKGTAVETLVTGLDAACFAGDDEADLAAFDALARLRADGALDLGVRVGVRSSEMPERLRAAADVVVDGPAGLAAFLTEISRGGAPRPAAR